MPPDPFSVPTITPPTRRIRPGIFIATALAITALATIFVGVKQVSSVPDDFTPRTTVVVPAGSTLKETADILEKKNVITSAFWFNIIVTFSQGQDSIKAGEYLFEEPLSLRNVIRRVTQADFGFPAIKLTVPEGLSSSEISFLVASKFKTVDIPTFKTLAAQEEGFLFPETYSFPENVNAEAIIAKMRSTFIEKTESLETEIKEFGRSMNDTVTMASILEEEGKTTESRQMIADILWRRLEIGMPLQVDATFLYINGKNTYELTTEDLKIDSPYNTYRYKGLPPTPISNPGLDSITASIRPIKNSYLYYLSEKDGTMHYAKTYAEHLRNKERYIP